MRQGAGGDAVHEGCADVVVVQEGRQGANVPQGKPDEEKHGFVGEVDTDSVARLHTVAMRQDL